MPNWCANTLTIDGPAADIKRFKEFACGTDHHGRKEILCADKIIPYPKEFLDKDRKAAARRKAREKLAEKIKLEELNIALQLEFDAQFPHVRDGYNSGGYQWCVKNWGTKWGFCEVNRTVERNSLTYTFETAWSPPTPLVKKMGELFPRLHFVLNYEEPGCSFAGTLESRKGKVILDDCHEYVHKEDEDA